MKMRTANRALALTLTTVAAACAPGAGVGDVGDLRAGLDPEGALCDLRVESAYDEPIQAGVRAGAREVTLGTLDPNQSIEILVPCFYGAVTVFRLVRHDEFGGDTRLGLRSQALNPQGPTVVTMRPVANRVHLQPGR